MMVRGRLLELPVGQGPGPVGVHDIKSIQHRPEGILRPQLELTQDLVHHSVQLAQGDKTHTTAVEGPPRSRHAAFEPQRTTSTLKVRPRDPVRLVAVQQLSPGLDVVRKKTQETGLELLSSFRIGLDDKPLRRVPDVQEHDIGLVYKPYSRQIQRLENVPQVAKWISKSSHVGQKLINVQLSLPTQPTCPVSPSLVRVQGLKKAHTAAKPRHREGPKAAQSQGCANIEFLQRRNTIAIRIQRRPQKSEVAAEADGLTRLEQLGLCDVHIAVHVQQASPGSDEVPVLLAQGLSELLQGPQRDHFPSRRHQSALPLFDGDFVVDASQPHQMWEC
mmetsp:Transcript_3579/g.8428  ORF Transcript_3579/g.8428 Transcript_3579/m.8428 type:complete len:332 (+) Transcript_3579:408-1403(+)